jgi:Fur family ferric uptake transcriptional regulator
VVHGRFGHTPGAFVENGNYFGIIQVCASVAHVTEDLLEQQLRDAGLRVTVPRTAVLRVLTDADDHPRVDQVIERVRRAGVPISTQAAYDVCEALHRAALARRIEPAGGPARYEARVGDNHHHLVCRGCGLAVDVDCAVGHAPCLDPGTAAAGFLVDEAEVTFWGLCPDCQRHDQGVHP